LTPTGFGETLRNETVGQVRGGVVALALGKASIDATTDSIKSIDKRTITGFFNRFIFSTLIFFVVKNVCLVTNKFSRYLTVHEKFKT
jgi:hypothetical protein